MELLKQKGIGDEIIKLIRNASEHVILISPFCHFLEWQELKEAISDAIERNVHVELFTRNPSTSTHRPSTIQWLDEVGVWIYTVANLHAKLYMNEKTAIVTSLNLLHFSHLNSVEIGFSTHDSNIVEELYENYYLLFLNSGIAYNYHITFKIEIPTLQELMPWMASLNDVNDMEEG